MTKPSSVASPLVNRNSQLLNLGVFNHKTLSVGRKGRIDRLLSIRNSGRYTRPQL